MVQPVVTFQSIYIVRELWGLMSEVVEAFSRSCLFGKNDPLRENFPKFVLKGFIATQIHVLCANFVKFGRPEVGEITRCLPDKKIPIALSLSLLRRLCPKSAAASGKQCTESAPNFIQIGSLPAEL